MNRLLWVPFLLASCAAAGDDLARLSDEFDNPKTLSQWKNFSAVEAFPDRIEKLDVNATSPGHLYIVPRSAAWWRGYHGVFLFKEIRGDFSVSTRVRVTGKQGGVPVTPWTISGLMARRPGDLAKTPDQRTENWLYLMAGRGPKQALVIDAKSTRESENVWDITPLDDGWVELGMARIGPWFISYCRPDKGEWTVRKRTLRDDLPDTLQVGLNVTSGLGLSPTMPFPKWNSAVVEDEKHTPDNVSRFEYVRFHRPAAAKDVAAATDAELLKLFVR